MMTAGLLYYTSVNLTSVCMDPCYDQARIGGYYLVRDEPIHVYECRDKLHYV